MSSAILYVAIVAIWAGVLIPRWLRRDSSPSSSSEQAGDDLTTAEPDSAADEEPAHQFAAGDGPCGPGNGGHLPGAPRSTRRCVLRPARSGPRPARSARPEPRAERRPEPRADGGRRAPPRAARYLYVAIVAISARVLIPGGSGGTRPPATRLARTSARRNRIRRRLARSPSPGRGGRTPLRWPMRRPARRRAFRPAPGPGLKPGLRRARKPDLRRARKPDLRRARKPDLRRARKPGLRSARKPGLRRRRLAVRPREGSPAAAGVTRSTRGCFPRGGDCSACS